MSKSEDITIKRVSSEIGNDDYRSGYDDNGHSSDNNGTSDNENDTDDNNDIYDSDDFDDYNYRLNHVRHDTTHDHYLVQINTAALDAAWSLILICLYCIDLMQQFDGNILLYAEYAISICLLIAHSNNIYYCQRHNLTTIFRYYIVANIFRFVMFSYISYQIKYVENCNTAAAFYTVMYDVVLVFVQTCDMFREKLDSDVLKKYFIMVIAYPIHCILVITKIFDQPF